MIETSPSCLSRACLVWYQASHANYPCSFTSSTALRVIARTQQQLKEEEKRLRALAADKGINKEVVFKTLFHRSRCHMIDCVASSALQGDDKDDLSGDDNVGEAEVEAVDRAFQRRQKLMSAEVCGVQ